MITKSNYVIGHQCQRCFWFKYNKYKDPSEDDQMAQQRMKDGDYVGEEVKKTFPEGIEIPFLGGDYAKMYRLTKEAIFSDIEVIFEGSFLVDGVFIRVDVMEKTPNGWNIYEVKSSSSLKPEHKEDVGVQWHVLNQIKEIDLKDIYVTILNKENSKKDNYQFLIPFKDENEISRNLSNSKSEIYKIFIDKTDSVLAATDLAVCVSGTASLECLLNQVPSVVCYKTNFFNNFLLNQFLKTKYISLPNILAEEKLIPELRQGFVNVDQIEKELLDMNEAKNLDRIKMKFHEIHNSLKVNQEDKFNCLFDLV